MSPAFVRALGARVVARRALGGGSLGEVHALTLDDGRRVVLKRDPRAGAEARMLRLIRATGCPAPEVLAEEDDAVLMTALPDGGRPGPADWAAAGRAIALLHGATGDVPGWSADHGFGPVAIPNAPAPDWPSFWADRRLRPLAPPDLSPRIEALVARLPDLLPRDPRPALLHGDLWSGNLLFGPDGFSGVIDPACFHGDAEVDLAMLTLFGAPDPAFAEAYGPLPDGWAARRPIYQLWPALVHLRLFGGGYRGLVDRLLDAAKV